ncbi:MAG: 30S ribosomal protein S4 [Victivallales bacterium]|nr:30S ribosomal protein S4 [Victivallales bacterium]MBR6373361.1 30S ribosomal protein S4 [Victivallales bacterium]
MADAKKASVRGPKHTMCRRVGYCLWGKANCPTASRTVKGKDGKEITINRPYPAGQHGPTKRRGKLSTYGELLLEKQKLRTFYNVSERQLRFLYEKARQGQGITGDKLLASLEMRLTTAVYRAGLAPTIFAARQIVSHRHVLVDGKPVNRGGYRLKKGQVVSIDPQRSPVIADIAKGNDAAIPSYFQKEAGDCKFTVLDDMPKPEDINNNIEITKVIEFYAR